MRIGALLLPLLPLFGQQTPPGGVNFYSIEKEVALGGAVASDFKRQHPTVNDENLYAYLVTVATRLNQFARSPFVLSIAVSADTAPKADALAFPGGNMFVPLGLLLAAQNEAELAGSIAHSLGHIVARHGTRQATRGQIVNLSTIPLIFMGGWGHHPGSNVLIPVGFQPFQRRDEAEADQLAAEWMSQAGYSPSAYVKYLERVQPSSILSVEDRLASFASAPEPAASSDTGQFVAARTRARLLAPAPAEPKPPTLRRPQ